jgi:protein-S-isoprenylcysteine O-methyltransferase Ste14
MNALRQIENKQETSAGPLPGLLRPPIIFLAAILLGIALNRACPLHFVPSDLGWLGSLVIFSAVLLFLLSFREFRAAGTPVSGRERTATIVRTGPYRLSRNPIYLSFVMLVLGLSVSLNDLWLLMTLVPVVGLIAAIVIPREERFLQQTFGVEYRRYKCSVSAGSKGRFMPRDMYEAKTV